MHLSQYLPRTVPEALQPLVTLALDLRWNWYHGTDVLWRRIDPELWESSANPWLILQTVSDQRLDELAADPSFVADVQRVFGMHLEHALENTWFSSHPDNHAECRIAYFSMEFGLSESLPLYSGGLGVLAGDFLKTASDLGVPVIGVGLMYQQGYFRQAVDAFGQQLEFYPYSDPSMLPVVPLRDSDGHWINIALALPGRALHLRTWQVTVGRTTLLLLDTNDPRNDPADRCITSELYGGGSEKRLQQEIVLGIGGWRLLEQLDSGCTICHLNEGHVAFALLERARCYQVRNRGSFADALCATRAGNLFTIHTPVAAGEERYPFELVVNYFRSYAEQCGVAVNELLQAGRVESDTAPTEFNMTRFAVGNSGAVSAVSALHREVTLGLLQPLFPRWPHTEVPVGHVTNGVHMASWDSAVSDKLWTRACGKSRWRGALEQVEDNLRSLGDAALWELRMHNRQTLVNYLGQRARQQHHCRWARTPGCSEQFTFSFDPDALTVGFARRFAEYKRPDLLLHDCERLERLLTDRDRPVQLVIAGKAHPRDTQGKALLRAWFEFLDRPAVRGRAVFIEDYDLDVAAQLVQGVDLWVNTPRRPWEACGTSGMKILVNGGLNLSVLDGWWAEAFTSEVGWAIGNGDVHPDTASWDRADAEDLYCKLEQDIVPCFYERDERGLPMGWIMRMRESMAHLSTQFSSNRMLRDYTDNYYLPLAARAARRTPETVRDLRHWYETLQAHWHTLHFGNVSCSAEGDGYRFNVQLYTEQIPPDAIRLELYAEGAAGQRPDCVPLARGEPLLGSANAHVYTGLVPAGRPSADYTPRVVPAHAEASVPLEAGFILWHR